MIKDIFADSIILWNMDEPIELKAVGDVVIGVELVGVERETSLCHGGDGKVAQFNGGYLIACQNKKVDLSGKKEMTFCIRLCDITGNWDSPIFARYDVEDRLSKILHCAQINENFISYETKERIQDSKSLEFIWRTETLKNRVKQEFLDSDWFKHLYNISATDFVDGILRIGVPVDIIGPQQWHDVIIRFKNANLELFVNGVLVDEEWPHGALYHFCSPFLIGAAFEDGKIRSGFHGMIDHIAIWDRALNDEEIISISGGNDEVKKQEINILGEENIEAQYWRPRGYNTFVGDCMPFYHDGEFHLYYLFDRRHHTSKWGMGAHQFAHLSSKDLINWKNHPLSLPITEQWECSLGTGCIIYHEGKYHEFYIHHGKRGYFSDSPYMRETILSAIGDDGINFIKNPEPVVPIDYREFGDVNPDVFPDPSGKRYYMSISGWKVFVSTDLTKWEETEELTSPRDIPRWICCSYFEWNGWYYFAGCGMYRMSREPLGPGWKWIEPENPATQEGLGVPKIAAFKGNRYLMVGFLGNGYGGEAVFRELVQHDDGTLGTKFPLEMIPKCGEPISLTFLGDKKEISSKIGSININAKDNFIYGFYDHVPKNARITLRVKPDPDARFFGLCLRGKGNYEEGCELRFEPESQRVQYGFPDGRGLATESNRCINGVIGLNEEFKLDIIVKNDFVDTCIDDRRTIITRFSDKLNGDRLMLFASNGSVTFEDIQIRPLI